MKVKLKVRKGTHNNSNQFYDSKTAPRVSLFTQDNNVQSIFDQIKDAQGTTYDNE